MRGESAYLATRTGCLAVSLRCAQRARALASASRGSGAQPQPASIAVHAALARHLLDGQRLQSLNSVSHSAFLPPLTIPQMWVMEAKVYEGRRRSSINCCRIYWTFSFTCDWGRRPIKWSRRTPCPPRSLRTFLQGLCPGEKARIVGTFRLKTDPGRPTNRASFRWSGHFLLGFLQAMMVEWLFAMHA
jgi:hypothetical protein